jgi:AmmeMemoRadiSam system protein B
LPIGSVPVDEQLLDALRSHADLSDDQAAHLREHAIEVQLPLLHARQPAVRVAPLCLGPLARDECVELGRQIASAVRSFAGPVLIVASTDMSHYVSAEMARRLDALAIARVLALDAEGLYDTVTEHGISMCGFVPTTVGMVAARELGATRSELVGYTNSGETSGDFDHVVGYAGALLS